MSTKPLLVIVALGFAGAVLAAHPEPAKLVSASQTAALRLAPCNQEGISPPAKCGTFTVWENRDTKAGRTIDLNVVLLEAPGPDHQPDPWVFLMGGPGEAATSAAAQFNAHEVRKKRDILLVDVRGTGRSNGLYCQPGKTAPPQAFMPLIDVPMSRACPKQLEKQADLRYYLTGYAMDDLDDLRAALGYEKINIQAGSHGTLSALVYIRRHGKHVRSATLTAATALSHPMPLHFATDTEGSLQNVLRDCAAEAACAAAFPALKDDYQRTVRRINENGPMRVKVRDPRNGDSVAVNLSATDFAESLRAMLYSPESTRSVPALLHHASTTGDYRAFAEFQLERNVSIAEEIAKGQYFAVTCTEDIARIDPKAVYAAGRGTFLDDHRARPHIESCKGWPLGRIPAGFGEEVQSDVPILIVNGESDPATPPTAARVAASRLSNARVIIVPQGSHNMEGLTGVECVEGIVARFLETADPQALDTTCVANVRRKSFILKPPEIR